ncbi:MAG: branched-chain amino acid ABC transporter permease [Archangium sp.]|nr:branched-chain amino acid ABC transporter permease [Archangium sp.]
MHQPCGPGSLGSASVGGRRPFATVARTKRLRRGWCRRVAGVDAVHVKSFLPVVAAVVVLGVLQWALGSSDYFVYLASLVGVNVVLAVSLNIINGMTGQFSIGHAGFMAVGAYVSGTTSLLLKDQQLSFLGPLASDQLFLLVSLLIGGVSAGVFGFLVGLPSLRLRGDYLAIVTLGFGEIIRVVIQNSDSIAKAFDGIPVLSLIGDFVGHFGGALGVSGVPQTSTFFMVWFWVFVVVLLARRLADSSHGRSLKAIREDEVAAEAMGVDTTSYKVRAFVVSSFFAGIAGGLFAHFVPIINPGSFTFVKSMEVVVMIVAGGLGSTTGAIVAAVILTLLPEALRTVFLQLGGGDASLAQKVDQIRMPIYGGLLVLIMLTRSQGIFGTHEAWDLWGRWKKRRAGAAT